MKDTDLIAELRHLKINTKSIACLGCGYENGCSVHGCRLIGLAADRLNEVGIILSIIRGMHAEAKDAEAKDAEKSLLGIVLSLFDRYYGLTPSIWRNTTSEQQNSTRHDVLDAIAYAARVATPRKRITDFELCADAAEMAKTLRCIDENGYFMSGVTQDGSGVYTVFFRRPVSE